MKSKLQELEDILVINPPSLLVIIFLKSNIGYANCFNVFLILKNQNIN